jgi:CHASE2 domain-containing sensor protein
MISWIVIVVLVIAGIIAIKMNHLRHRVFIILLVIFALFLYSTIVIVDRQEELDFSTSEGILDSGKVYLGWLANGFNNIKFLAGKAIKMDWSSTNSTFLNNSED